MATVLSHGPTRAPQFSCSFWGVCGWQEYVYMQLPPWGRKGLRLGYPLICYHAWALRSGELKVNKKEDICVLCYHIYESLQVLDFFFFHFFSFFSFFLHNKPIIGSLILQMRKQAQRNNLPQNTLFISDGGKKERKKEERKTQELVCLKHLSTMH